MDVFFWIAVAVVVIVASSRLTRLLTYDDFPPVRWVRNKYIEATDGSSWQLLGYCPWCMSFWATLTVVLSGYFSDWHTVWWIVWGALAASYLAAMLMVRDGDTSDEDEN